MTVPLIPFLIFMACFACLALALGTLGYLFNQSANEASIPYLARADRWNAKMCLSLAGVFLFVFLLFLANLVIQPPQSI